MVTRAGSEVVGQRLRQKDATGREFVAISRPAVGERERVEATLDTEVEAGELDARLAEVPIDIDDGAGHDQGALEGSRRTQRRIGGETVRQPRIKLGSTAGHFDVIPAPTAKRRGSIRLVHAVADQLDQEDRGAGDHQPADDHRGLARAADRFSQRDPADQRTAPDDQPKGGIADQEERDQNGKEVHGRPSTPASSAPGPAASVPPPAPDRGWPAERPRTSTPACRPGSGRRSRRASPRSPRSDRGNRS